MLLGKLSISHRSSIGNRFLVTKLYRYLLVRMKFLLSFLIYCFDSLFLFKDSETAFDFTYLFTCMVFDCLVWIVLNSSVLIGLFDNLRGLAYSIMRSSIAWSS